MIFIDVICNCIEALLFFIFLRVSIGYEERYKLFAKFGWILIAAFTTVSNYVHMDLTLSYIISTTIEFAYAACFFDHTNGIRFLYSFALLVFSSVSNYMTFFIVSLIDVNVLSQSLHNAYRLETVSLYTLILTFCFLLAMIWKPKKTLFRKPHIIYMFALLLINTCSVIAMISFTLHNADKVDSLLPLGIISLILLFVTFMIIGVFYRLAVLDKKYYDEQIELINLRNEKTRFEQIQGTYDYLRKSKHDESLHLRTIRGLANAEGKSAAVVKYVDELLDDNSSIRFGVYTGNTAVDAVISESALTASKNNIDFQTTIICPEKLPMPDFEFCSIIGNLLDNALEACNKIANYKYIKLQIDFNDANLRVIVINSSNGQYKIEKSSLITDKESSQYHGIGIKRIKALVSKYDGMCSFSPQSDYFKVIIYLPI